MTTTPRGPGPRNRRLSRRAVVLLWVVLLVPVVAVAGDQLERAAADASFTLPPLREGASYRYDASVDGTGMPGPRGAAAFLTINVGHVAPLRLVDGSVSDVVPIATSRAPAAWDLFARPSFAPELQRLAVEYQQRDTEYLRVSDGRVARFEHGFTEQQWFDVDGSIVRYQAGTEATHEDGSHGPTAAELDEVFGRRFSWDAPLYGSKSGASGLVRGTLDGHEVFGIVATDRSQVPPGPLGALACRTPLPAYEHRAPVSIDDAGTLWRVEQHELWVRPDLALPVAAACRVTLHEDVPHGPVAAEIGLRLSLSAHDPGGEVIPVDAIHHGPVGARGAMTPRPVPFPGTAPQGDAPFPFPLTDALQRLRDDTSEPLASFRDAGARPFTPLESGFYPGAATCTLDGGPAAVACGPTAPARDAEASRKPSWSFLLVNEAGAVLRATVTRELAPGGVPVDERVSAGYVPRPLWYAGVDPERMPQRLVPMGAVLADWMKREGTTYARWSAQPGAAFFLSFDAAHLDAKGEYLGDYTIVSMGGAPAAQASPATADACPLERSPILAEAARACTRPAAQVHRDAPEDLDQSITIYRASDGLLRGDARLSMSSAPEVAGFSPQNAPAAAAIEPQPAPHVPQLAWVAAVAVLVSAAAAPWWRRLSGHPWRWLGLVAAYAKVQRSQALDHPARRAIIDGVTADPGVTTKQLADRLGLGWGTTVYHLSVLEQHDLIESRAGGRYRGWFVPGAVTAEDKRALAVLRWPAARRVYEGVRATPGASHEELASRFGIDRTAVLYQTKRLAEAGLVARRREGRTIRLYPERAPTV